MADGLRRMLFKPEVSAADRKVSGYCHFLACSQVKQGSVVADSEA